MKQETKYICECGQVAIAKCKDTGRHLCIECLVRSMRKDAKRSKTGEASFSGEIVNEVILAPRGDGATDILMPLADVTPLSFSRN